MTGFLLLAFIFLVAGVVAVPLATKLGLGSVLGYLIAGILISPLLVVLDVDVVSIQHFAEFGVVMMLFLVGLELEPKKLWQMRHRLLGLGGLQMSLTTLAVMALAFMSGQSWSVSLAIGLVFSLSSTAIVLQTLNEKGLMKSNGGQASFSVLLFQDIAVIPIMAFIPLLALPGLLESGFSQLPTVAKETHDTFSLVEGLNTWQTVLVTVAAMSFVLIVGKSLTRPFFRFISLGRLRELFLATTLMMVVSIALLMSLVGLSPALGTFLAGVVLATSEYRHELESNINPFKGLLLGLFFITVGASIDFALLVDNFFPIIGMTFAIILIKGAVLYALAISFKIKGMNLWLLALGLAQAGEFGFVLLNFTVANSVIPSAVADQLMLVVAMSMLMTPILFIIYDRLIDPWYANQQQPADEINEKSDIIIIGHGRMGGIVNRLLRSAGYVSTVIDYSSSQLDMLRKFGLRVFFGDGTRPDLLHAAGIENARMLIIAIDNKEDITNLTEHIIRQYPHIHVLARAIDRTHVYDLWSVGCRDIIRETYDSSLRMGQSALEALGYKHRQAYTMTQSFRERDYRNMLASSKLYKRGVPLTENQPFVDYVKKLLKDWESDLQGHSMLKKASKTTAKRSSTTKTKKQLQKKSSKPLKKASKNKKLTR